MEKYYISLIVFTTLWGIVGIIAPFLIPRGPNKPLIQVMLTLTAACCWMFWLCFYLHQLNPLFGPQLTSLNARVLKTVWSKDF